MIKEIWWSGSIFSACSPMWFCDKDIFQSIISSNSCSGEKETAQRILSSLKLNLFFEAVCFNLSLILSARHDNDFEEKIKKQKPKMSKE